MLRLKYYITKLLKCLLLLLFIGYYSNITMFYHAHMVDGHILSHSHPYKHDKNNKSPFESHSHSSSAYNYIHQLNEASWKDTAVSANVPCPTIYQLVTAPVIFTPFIEASAYSFRPLRAPPTTC